MSSPANHVLPNVAAGIRTPAQTRRSLPVLDPATGNHLAQVPLSGEAEVTQGVAAAIEAHREWASVPVQQRARLMFRVQQITEAAHEDLARLVSLENGKAIRDARGEITRALEVLEFAAGIPTLMQGLTTTNLGRGVDAETRLYPLGVVAGITPFNFPAMIPFWMIPIAVAAGNAFILKPSEQTPLTAMRVIEIFEEAGLPSGVLNLVHGDAKTVNALIDHPDVAAISFVGSARVARNVYKRAAANGKRVQALAGAKNYLLVLDDAPLDRTADQVFASAFGNAGQRCLAGSVLLVTPGIRQGLLEALTERIRSACRGPGSDERNVITPVISAQARQRITDGVEEAVADGARLILGGRIPEAIGNYVEPTLVDNVRPGMKILDEELFGPVLAIVEVVDLEEAITVANASKYGNSSSLFTSSGAAARMFRERIEAGMLGINVGVPAPIGYLPFSGWKGSFYGDLHTNGTDGVRFYTRVKAITTHWLEAPPAARPAEATGRD